MCSYLVVSMIWNYFCSSLSFDRVGRDRSHCVESFIYWVWTKRDHFFWRNLLLFSTFEMTFIRRSWFIRSLYSTKFCISTLMNNVISVWNWLFTNSYFYSISIGSVQTPFIQPTTLFKNFVSWSKMFRWDLCGCLKMLTNRSTKWQLISGKWTSWSILE